MSNFQPENKIQFVEAVRETAKNSGFSESLIEKDYYCSLILKEIFRSKDCALVFKGGTLLNKCHVGFYRLSEDLDFSISNIEQSPRKKRSNLARIAKKCVKEAVKNLSLTFSKPFKGHDENRLYNAEIEYDSLVAGDKKTIKIEFGIHEKVLEKEKLMAKTLLKNPITQNPVLLDFPLVGLSLKEAYSEKIRAAFSREKSAIRDIFDIHYALKNCSAEKFHSFTINKLSPMVKMVKCKMKVSNQQIDLSEKRKEEFLSQLQTELRPVLRQKDFEEFNFEQVWKWLKTLEKKILKSP